MTYTVVYKSSFDKKNWWRILLKPLFLWSTLSENNVITESVLYEWWKVLNWCGKKCLFVVIDRNALSWTCHEHKLIDLLRELPLSDSIVLELIRNVSVSRRHSVILPGSLSLCCGCIKCRIEPTSKQRGNEWSTKYHQKPVSRSMLKRHLLFNSEMLCFGEKASVLLLVLLPSLIGYVSEPWVPGAVLVACIKERCEWFMFQNKMRVSACEVGTQCEK